MQKDRKKLEYFKDKLFDLLNESDDMGIKDIENNDRENIYRVYTQDGYLYEVECRQVVC